MEKKLLPSEHMVRGSEGFHISRMNLVKKIRRKRIKDVDK